MSEPRRARVRLLDEVPGLVHGFEQRAPSAGETREAARARLERSLGDVRLLLLKQVHGNRVAQAPWRGRPEADAAVSREPGVVLGIETADCLPVFVVDPRRRVAAAAHAGWRGTAAGVTREAVRALVQDGSSAVDLMAALGPCIGPCCYEVGEDVQQAFGARGAPFFREGRRGRPHLDVRAANRAQLQEAGVPAERIASVDDCTSCRADLYHSYRRDGRAAGRMISFVGFLRYARRE